MNPGFESPAADRPGHARRFFVGYGVLFIVLAAIGFGPSFLDYFQGTYYFPPIVHLHGALMLGWLLAYVNQARLASNGDLRLHRKLGAWSIALAAAVWTSMFVATIVALRRNDPAGNEFMASVLLIQTGSAVVFPTFVAAGLLLRNDAGWHRRMMTFAALVLLQAAVDRMGWIPDEGLPMFWHHAVRLYALLIPLFVFDLLSLRRVHPATVLGTVLIVAMHGVVSAYWDDPGWIGHAMTFWSWVR